MDVQLEVRDWSGGIVGALEHDEIPDNAFVTAWNTAFRSIGQGKAVIGMRPGMDFIGQTAGAAEIARMIPYTWKDGTTYKPFLMLCDTVGKVYYKDHTDVVQAFLNPPANWPYHADGFTAGSHYDGTVISNTVFIVNGLGERRAIMGTTFTPFGLSPVAVVAVSNQAGGSAGMPAEEYRVTITSYDSNSGEESSSLSSTTVTLVAGERIRVIITPTSAETAQYSHWRVYLQRQTTQARAYRVLVLEDVGGSNIVTDGNIPIGTTTVYVDLTAAQIAALILPAPNTTENNPPVDTVRFAATYGNRLILADNQNVYWSNYNKPRGFNPLNFEPIADSVGNKIMGLHRYSDDLLMVFTLSSVWGFFGNDPQSWTVKPIDVAVGCGGHASIVAYEKKVAWWSTEHGPVEFDGAIIRQLGDDFLGANLAVNPARLANFQAAHDPRGDRIVFTVSQAGGTVNNVQYPYNYRVQRWESDLWDGFDSASLATAFGANGTQYLYMGGNVGHLMRYDETLRNDGIHDSVAVRSWSYIATTTSTTVFTGTTGFGSSAECVARKITIVDTVTNTEAARRIIGTHDNTSVTVTVAVTTLVVGRTYTIHLANPNIYMQSKWYDFGIPFQRKRFDRIYFHTRSVDESFTTFNVRPRVAYKLFFEDDITLWDSSPWLAFNQHKARVGLWKTGTALQINLTHFPADQDFILLKLAVYARVLDDRYYGSESV